MTDYNAGRRFIKARMPQLVGHTPGRSKQIKGIFIHSTRSGRSAGDDGPGTENWANHPQNSGAFWDFLIFENGQQVKCTNWEKDENPQWAGGFGEAGTWSAQDYYIHVEVAQGNINDPFTAEQIESLAQWSAEMAKQYGFAVKRIPFLSQKGAPPEGFCDHENSANGKKLGKSDPGPMFPWRGFLARVQELVSGEDEMTKEEREVFNLMRERITTLEAALTGADKDTVGAMRDHMKKGLRPVLDRINTLETTPVAVGGQHVHALPGNTGPALPTKG